MDFYYVKISPRLQKIYLGYFSYNLATQKHTPTIRHYLQTTDDVFKMITD